MPLESSEVSKQVDVATPLSLFNLFFFVTSCSVHQTVGGTIHALFNAFFSGVRFVMLIFRQKARFNFIICLHFAFCNNPASSLVGFGFIMHLIHLPRFSSHIFFGSSQCMISMGGRRQLMLIHTLMKDKLHRLHLLCYCSHFERCFYIQFIFVKAHNTASPTVLTENVITTF